MTAWYTGIRTMEDAGLNTWAFSVRPDLWPPGTVADVADTSHGWLANWDSNGSKVPDPDPPDHPLAEYEAPGAAEALILAGRVAVNPRWDRSTCWHWTEVPAP